jgi:hypothetical protein
MEEMERGKQQHINVEIISEWLQSVSDDRRKQEFTNVI